MRLDGSEQDDEGTRCGQDAAGQREGQHALGGKGRALGQHMLVPTGAVAVTVPVVMVRPAVLALTMVVVVLA